MTTDLELQADPTAAGASPDTLGWADCCADDPAVAALRRHLEAHSGIRGLEVLTPEEPERAAELFYRDGFVVVRDALSPAQLASLRAACERVACEILALDKRRIGNRGSHRYSFGGASLTGQQLHNPEWAMLIDLPTVTPILTAIFGCDDYHLRGAGGDFCLPGAINYQPLHSDIADRRPVTFPNGETRLKGAFHDPRGLLSLRDLPCPYACCNFLMVDFTATNGPIRQIPGTQHSRAPIPALEEEPPWMKLSTVCPAPAGSVLIRDVRAWHGGTPNLSNVMRAIPNAEFFAPWYREPTARSLPRALYNRLSPFGRKLARHIVADPDESLPVGYRDDLGYVDLAKAAERSREKARSAGLLPPEAPEE